MTSLFIFRRVTEALLRMPKDAELYAVDGCSVEVEQCIRFPVWMVNFSRLLTLSGVIWTYE